MKFRAGFRMAACTALLGVTIGAFADYPDRAIKIIVPWPAGGVTDTLARFSAEQLQKAVGQPVFVDNKGGANGIIGTQAAAAMPADGYGLLTVTAETHAINPSVYRPLPYDPIKDFDPIAMVAHVSFVLAVQGDLPVSSIKEMVAYAKAHPDKLSAASYGVGSTSHLGLAAFEKLSGTKYIHVPFKGVAPAVNALLGGQVDLAFVNAFNVEPHRKTGKVKVLGVAGATRLNTMTDVPTMAEQGFPMEAGNWYGFVMPQGAPVAVREKLASELQKIAQSKVFQDKAYAMGVQAEFRSASQFGEFLKSEGVRLGEIVRERQIELER